MATPAFKEIFSRDAAEWTFELFDWLKQDFGGVEGCVYFGFGKTSNELVLLGFDDDLLGYGGASGHGDARTEQHQNDVLMPLRAQAAGRTPQKVHVDFRERGSTMSFVLMADERQVIVPVVGKLQEAHRYTFESIVKIGMGLLKKDIHFSRQAHLAFALAAQPDDTKAPNNTILGCNGELSIKRPFVSTVKPVLGFSCPAASCDKSPFPSIPAVERHMAEEHGLPDLYYMCEQEDCGQGFHNKGALKAHMVVHTKERPYICGPCGMAYKSQLSLDRHQNERCDVAIIDCEAPGCDERGTTREVALHRIKVHDYCTKCKHVLTYELCDVENFGNLQLRQIHEQNCSNNDHNADHSGVSVREYAKCDKCLVPGCGHVTFKFKNENHNHPACEWGCGFFYPVWSNANATNHMRTAARQQHAAVCTGPLLDASTRAAVFSETSIPGTMCGISGCRFILPLRKDQLQNHIGSHWPCGKPSCNHVYASSRSLRSEFFAGTKMKGAARKRLQDDHSRDCPTNTYTPIPDDLALPALQVQPPLPAAQVPRATPANGHLIPSMAESGSGKSRKKRPASGDHSTRPPLAPIDNNSVSKQPLIMATPVPTGKNGNMTPGDMKKVKGQTGLMNFFGKKK
ncbi:zinc-finger protein [Elasticomyces elasticus]|nr:zinc-finger protein [Elasticomyces elasticus]